MRATILFLLMFSSVVFANTFSVRIDASVSNIGTSFNGTYPQLAITLPRNPQSVFVDNRSTGSEIAVNCASVSGVPADNGVWVDQGLSLDDNIYVAGGEAWSISAPGITNKCYVRSMTGSTLTSGIYVLTITGG